jgi:hypothetical protein
MAWRDIAPENEDRGMRSGGRGSNNYLTHGAQVCDIKFDLPMQRCATLDGPLTVGAATMGNNIYGSELKSSEATF